MAKEKAEHDIEWQKFYVAVAPRIMPSRTILSVVGVGTGEDCLEDIKFWYRHHKYYTAPARLVSFTGAIVEINVQRSGNRITLGKPRTVQPFVNPPPQQIPTALITGPNPSGVEWQNLYCVIAVIENGQIIYAPSSQTTQSSASSAKRFAYILTHGMPNYCKFYLEFHTEAYIHDTQSYTLLSLDGHVYRITAKLTRSPKGKVNVKNGPSKLIKSWPPLRIWR